MSTTNITGVIYKITCTPTGSSYIGKTIQKLSIRLQQHKYKASCCRLLSEKIQEYGWDKFTVETLWEGPNNILGDMERKFIKENNTLSPNGYNLREGGGRSERMCEESRKLMVKSQQKNILKRNGFLGKIIENKSKIDGTTTSWSFKASRNSKTHTIANCKSSEEAEKIQQEYTKDPDNYNIPPEKRVANGKATGVYYNKDRDNWQACIGHQYLGRYETKEQAENIIQEFRKDPVGTCSLFNGKSKNRDDVGVSYHNGKGNWMASIYIDKKNRFLGNYSTKEEAINARKRFIEDPETFVRPNQRKKIKL